MSRSKLQYYLGRTGTIQPELGLHSAVQYTVHRWHHERNTSYEFRIRNWSNGGSLLFSSFRCGQKSWQYSPQRFIKCAMESAWMMVATSSRNMFASIFHRFCCHQIDRLALLVIWDKLNCLADPFLNDWDARYEMDSYADTAFAGQNFLLCENTNQQCGVAPNSLCMHASPS